MTIKKLRSEGSGSEGDGFSHRRLAWLFVVVAAGLAIALAVPARRRLHARKADRERIDEASDESFPASDPPSHSSPTASAGHA